MQYTIHSNTISRLVFEVSMSLDRYQFGTNTNTSINIWTDMPTSSKLLYITFFSPFWRGSSLPAHHSVIGISSEWFKVLDCQPLCYILCFPFFLWNTALQQHLVLWVVFKLQRFFLSFIYLLFYILHTANTVALIHTVVSTGPACISHLAMFNGKCDCSHLFML